MKTNPKQTARRLCAGALSIILLAGMAAPALAAPPVPQTDETVYVNLDYYGGLRDMRVVKGVALNGQTTFTDYGNYTDVVNMSTLDQPQRGDGSITWTLDHPKKQRFYFEGAPAEPEKLQMPWTFDVSYLLDGVPVRAEDCAGASGTIQMDIHAIPNENADEYYRNNMLLLCTLTADMEEVKSLEAPGAQIQSIGSYKAAVFLALPGEEATFTVRIGSDSFETLGAVLMMTPATMDALDRVKDLRETRDKVQDGADELHAGMTSLLGTLGSIGGGVQTVSGGLSGLDAVREQIYAANTLLDADTDQSLADLQSMIDQIDASIPELQNTQKSLEDLMGSTNTILNKLNASRSDIQSYRSALEALYQNLDALKNMCAALNDDLFGVDDLSAALNDTQEALDDLSWASSALQSDLGDLSFLLQSLPVPGVDLSGALADTSRLLSATSDIGSAGGTLAGVLRDTARDMNSYSNVTPELTKTLQHLTTLASSTLGTLDGIMGELPGIQTTLNTLTDDLTSLLGKSTDMLSTTKQTMSSTNQLLIDLRQTMLDARGQGNSSTAQTIRGMLELLDKAQQTTSATGHLQNATDSIYQTVHNELDDLDKDTNALNIDNSLALRSFTSSENPAPSSLQFILRTDEISVDELEKQVTDEPAVQDEGVWARIVNIFRKIGSAILSAFSEDQ